MKKRIGKLTYDYCTKPKDYLKIATPIMWPVGSPALTSLVRRIKPMVDISSGQWLGGGDFHVLMETMADTFNNWGLRGGFNKPTCHTIVPYWVKTKPLQRGSAANARWGISRIGKSNVICVNALWQTSKLEYGPPARIRTAWKEGSLVKALVNLANCRRMMKAQGYAAGVDLVGKLLKGCFSYLTTEEQHVIVAVGSVGMQVAKAQSPDVLSGLQVIM